jgi:AraC-like DNA-binding protein
MERKEVYAVQELYQDNLMVTHTVCGAHEYDMKNLHFHDGFEIWFTLTDNSGFYFENCSYTLNRGGLVLVNNSELHRTTAPPDGIFDRYIISFVPDYIAMFNTGEEDLFHAFINRPQGVAHYVQLTETQTEEFLDTISRLDRYIKDSRYGTELLKKLTLTELVTLCSGYFKGSVHFQEEQSSERLNPILQYIKNNINKDLTLDTLTAKFFISKTHLIRLFKAVTGMAPNEYIIMTRVMKARTYLSEGMPILKICELVGYADESHFIRTFKRIMGITPKQYSKLRRKNFDMKPNGNQ